VSAPHLDDVLGPDATPVERERLTGVHALLLEAGAPPELPPSLAPVTVAPPRLVPRRRRFALLALAAALGAGVFGVGYVLGERSDDVRPGRVVALSATEQAPSARGSLAYYAADDSGNQTVELTVRGLPPLPEGSTYELWLTRDGEPVARSGSFAVGEGETAVVSLTLPPGISAAHGWMVKRAGRDTPLLVSS
jgi:hypothetical protein